MPSILFECVHNACRSQIAEAVCRRIAPKWIVESAGSHPSKRVDRKAVRILKKHRLSMRHAKPQGFQDLPPIKWDVVVTMGCEAKCRTSLRAKRVVEWDIPDPEDGPMNLYQDLYEDLERRIKQLTGN